MRETESHRPSIKVGRKQRSASHRRSVQRRRRTNEEVKASRRDGVAKKRGRQEGGRKRGRKRKRRGTKEFVDAQEEEKVQGNEVVEEVSTVG